MFYLRRRAADALERIDDSNPDPEHRPMIKAVSKFITKFHPRRRLSDAAMGIARNRGSAWTRRAMQNAGADSLSGMTFDQLVVFITTG